MGHALTTTTGKLMQQVLRRFRGEGQALPGLIVERISPGYVAAMLGQLPQGVIFITGTNGKTTTAKIVTELLSAQHLRVLNNQTGSNMTRGLISCVLHNASWSGRIPFDIAVFEVDEAYAKQLATAVQPQYVLALNVSRDQLDRFGEVDAVAKLLEVPLRSARKGVVVNADDPYLAEIANRLRAESRLAVRTFGVSDRLQSAFPHESALASEDNAKESARPTTRTSKPHVLLYAFKDKKATYQIGGKTHPVQLRLSGRHNYQNAAAALALVCALLPDVSPKQHVRNLANVSEAFGRGQLYTLPHGKQVKLVLAKNPASFLQALASYTRPGTPVMIAINDDYADSRDVSWLWDIDFSLIPDKVVAVAAGSRAADIALRLSYDEVHVQEVIPTLPDALDYLIASHNDSTIFATYTAMMELHRLLQKQAVGGRHETA